MAAIRRVVFTGDILRPYPAPGGGWESATVKNIRWLEHLIGWQVAQATGLLQESVSWAPGGFDTPGFYDAMGLPVHIDSWASVFYAGEIPEAAAERLAAPFADALVIGVEIPDLLQRVLTSRDTPFVDIVAHPARFMDDLLFAFRTGHAEVHERLLGHEFDLEQCRPYANLLRAKAAWMPPLPLPEGAALITGQVATDKAVISRRTGRFLNLGDYVEQLFELCARHPVVLWKPHPYQGADCPSRRVIQSLRAVRTVDENFYYLMGQDAITDVYAISSGTVGEAPFFGKRGRAFAGPLYEFGRRAPADGGPGACVPVGAAFLSPAFWAQVLKPLVSTRDMYLPGPAPRPSRLRRSLNADWDHGFIDVVVQTPRNPGALTGAPEVARR